jgi:hypothetical protein
LFLKYLGLKDGDEDSVLLSTRRRAAFSDLSQSPVETIAVNEPVGLELQLTEHEAELFSMYQVSLPSLPELGHLDEARVLTTTKKKLKLKLNLN